MQKKDAYQLNHYREFSLQQFQLGVANLTHFYSAMHYSAKRSLALACRLSVCDIGGS